MTRRHIILGVLIGCVIGAGAWWSSFRTETASTVGLRLGKTESPIQAFQESLPELTETQGAAYAIEAVFAATKERLISSGECHLLLHNVGHAALAFSLEHSEALAVTSEVKACLGGYLHGIEAEIVESGQDARVRLWDMCVQARAWGIANGPCFHGVGHAALEWTQDVPKALAFCDSLAGGPEEDMRGCYRGVFSQLSDYIAGMSAASNPFPEVDPKNSFIYCRTLDEKFQFACQTQLSQRYNDVGNPLQGLKDCIAASVRDTERDVCANILAALETRKAYDEDREDDIRLFMATVPTAQRLAALHGIYESYSAAKNTYPHVRPWADVCADISGSDLAACMGVESASLQ
ncbi:MAG: hypothetical protein KBE09_03445 [Candidatus Pacebacteria bacterium]|nr:hypothetical protein [Candidatus Paceibacterota bacterium]